MPINASFLKIYDVTNNTYQEVPAIKGSSGVYVGSNTPVDEDVNIWVDPTNVDTNGTILTYEDLYSYTIPELQTTNQTMVGAINEIRVDPELRLTLDQITVVDDVTGDMYGFGLSNGKLWYKKLVE